MRPSRSRLTCDHQFQQTVAELRTEAPMRTRFAQLATATARDHEKPNACRASAESRGRGLALGCLGAGATDEHVCWGNPEAPCGE